MEITLDKNWSLYDPAGTESWNMQIRYETTKLTKHPTNNRSSPEWFPYPVKDWAGTWIERPQSISLCNRCVFVGWRHLKHTPSPCIKIRKGEDKGRKREKFYIYLDVTHTHTHTSAAVLLDLRGFGAHSIGSTLAKRATSKRDAVQTGRYWGPWMLGRSIIE